MPGSHAKSRNDDAPSHLPRDCHCPRPCGHGQLRAGPAAGIGAGWCRLSRPGLEQHDVLAALSRGGERPPGLTNQVNASCSLDVDPAVPTNGATPEGAVYAFAVTWVCPVNVSQVGVATWNSAMLWRPTLAESGDALAELTNQIDVSCTVDVNRVVAASGAGSETHSPSPGPARGRATSTGAHGPAVRAH